MNTRQLIVVAIAITLANSTVVFAEVELDGAANASEGELLFVRSVLPILNSKCHACHGDDEHDIRGELNLLHLDGTLRGGASGEAAIVPGHPGESPLYLAVTRNRDWSPMPPKDNDALNAKDVAQLRRWIELGAPWPAAERAESIHFSFAHVWEAEDGVPVATSGGLTPEWTNRLYQPQNLWSFRRLWKDTERQYRDTSATIDALIEEHMKRLGITPAPPADRRTLIRRTTFDLIGMPPTCEEVDAFANDPVDDTEALAKVVQRLLDSPHYGEKWGQHWLDVTRYADSSGFANDFERGNAWRYRDYVIRSFNEDKPYDQFVREQIAGDEIDPQDPENLIAVGFLRMGPWELTVMEVPKVARQRFLDDATDAIGQVFLGQMLQCARCHDHKFDPIPTRDYYAIQASLATTQLVERRAAFLAKENVNGFDEREFIEQRSKLYRSQLAELNKKSIAAARGWLADRNIDPADFKQSLADANGDFKGARRKLQLAGVTESKIPPRHAGFEPSDFGMDRIARKGLERLRWQLDRYQPFALSVYSGHTPKKTSVKSPQRVPKNRSEGELEQVAILAGGDAFSPTEVVRPAMLSALVGMSGKVEAENYVVPACAVSLFPGQDTSNDFEGIPVEGRRLALADWITSNENPLTARVMVNRIWLGHFGRGIAGNPNNFGATGKKPTHPRLLDWLATQFVTSGWSVKHMHRLILMSDTYRRSSTHPSQQELHQSDPIGESYAVFLPRRLTAEELRDAMLAVSGEINLQRGGIPVRPEINLEVALQPRMLMGTFAEAWQPSPQPEQRHRRSIYLLRLRGLRDPFLEVFNAPSPDLSTESRSSSTVTPQAFMLLNSQAIFTRALAMADRIVREANQELSADSRGDMIDRAFASAFQREPTDNERSACVKHWANVTKRHERIQLLPRRYPEEVVREAVEENTGEKFRFVEPLEMTRHFVPDIQPKDVTCEVRGLADVCLVLLNSNEFVYIY